MIDDYPRTEPNDVDPDEGHASAKFSDDLSDPFAGRSISFLSFLDRDDAINVLVSFGYKRFGGGVDRVVWRRNKIIAPLVHLNTP